MRKLNRVQGRACAVLRAAAGAGAAELVEQLAARGVDATCVDAIDKDSALHRATRAGHAATVRRLLEIAPNAWPMHRNRFTEVTSEVVVSVQNSVRVEEWHDTRHQPLRFGIASGTLRCHLMSSVTNRRHARSREVIRGSCWWLGIVVSSGRPTVL